MCLFSYISPQTSHRKHTKPKFPKKNKLKTQVKTDQTSAVHSQSINFSDMWLDMLDWLTTGWNSDTHTSNRNCFYSHMAASGHMIESETWSETQELMEVVASVSNSKKYGLIPAGRRLEQSRAECDYITHESMQWLAVLLKCTLGDLCHTKKLLPSCWSLGGVRRGDGVCVCVFCVVGVLIGAQTETKKKKQIPEKSLKLIWAQRWAVGSRVVKESGAGSPTANHRCCQSMATSVWLASWAWPMTSAMACCRHRRSIFL